MTEAEWLACEDPQPMLEAFDFHLPLVTVRTCFDGDLRRCRQFAISCCHQVWVRLPVWGKQTLGVLERYIDGRASEAEFRVDVVQQVSWAGARSQWLVGLAYSYGSARFDSPYAAARRVAEGCAAVDVPIPPVFRRAFQADLLRCIFGNPFHPVTILPEWRTGAVIALAQQMYESRDFSAMPILADALMDAGCSDEAILAHCRGNTPHRRGCHVIDALTGRS